MPQCTRNIYPISRLLELSIKYKAAIDLGLATANEWKRCQTVKKIQCTYKYELPLLWVGEGINKQYGMHCCPIVNLNKAVSNNTLHYLLSGIFCCISSDPYYRVKLQWSKLIKLLSAKQNIHTPRWNSIFSLLLSRYTQMGHQLCCIVSPTVI